MLAKHTLLHIDKDLYFGEILTMTLVFVPYYSWVFEQDAAFGNIGALGVVPIVSHFQLLFSLESNPVFWLPMVRPRRFGGYEGGKNCLIIEEGNAYSCMHRDTGHI